MCGGGRKAKCGFGVRHRTAKLYFTHSASASVRRPPSSLPPTRHARCCRNVSRKAFFQPDATLHDEGFLREDEPLIIRLRFGERKAEGIPINHGERGERERGGRGRGGGGRPHSHMSANRTTNRRHQTATDGRDGRRERARRGRPPFLPSVFRPSSVTLLWLGAIFPRRCRRCRHRRRRRPASPSSPLPSPLDPLLRYYNVATCVLFCSAV